MKPEIWGPSTWVFLHSITLNYPDSPTTEDKHNITSFFEYIGKVLPCDKCKVNFQSHLEKTPITDQVVSSRKNLVLWLIDIHNSVNRMNNKPVLSHEEALRKIITRYYCDNQYIIWVTVFLLIFVILCVIAIIVYKKLKS
jgi:hypothetical protein